MKSINFIRITLPAVIAVCSAAAMAAGGFPTSKVSPAVKMALGGNVQHKNAPSRETQYLNAFITVSDDFNAAVLAKLGVKTGACAGDIISARIPFNAVMAVSELPGVIYVEAAGKVTPMMDLARMEAGMPYIADSSNPQSSPVTGKGVIVGVIDRGFDYTHEAFRDAGGKCRISRVWEQASNSDKNPAPAKFGYGMEITDADDILTAGGDITGNSHGTHVASIAAGSSAFREGIYSGLAPESEIVLVSMDATDGDNTHLADAMAYIFDYAETAGKPCVINMSLGSQIGPHDGTSSFDRMADALAGEGRLLVGSAGNHGADKFHVSKTFASADDEPLATFIEFRNPLNTANAGGVIDIWGDKDMAYKVELLSYSKGKKAIDEIVTVSTDAQEAADYVFKKNVEGPFTVAVEENPNNGKQHVMIKSGVTSLRNLYCVGVRIIPETAGKVDIWADNNKLGLTANDVEGYAEPDSGYSTIAELGGTAASVLTVGAYTTRDEYTVMGSTDVMNIGQTMGDICSFSSFGPTADGRQKPEITAPGCYIISAVSSYDNSGTQVMADCNEEGGYRYGYMQGTSMASPFVTGVVAGWLEIDPTLAPERLKTTAMESARQDEHTKAGNPINWGAGKINPREGAIMLLANGITDISDDMAKPIIWPGEVVFPCSGKAEIMVSDMSGRIVSVSAADVTAGDSFRLSRDTIGTAPGIYIVRVLTAEGVTTAKVAL